jgi:hypothetical protein
MAKGVLLESDLILLARLNALEHNLRRVQLHIENARKRYKIDEKIWITFFDHISKPAKEYADTLDTLKNDRKVNSAYAWEEYSKISKKSEDIFAELLDFLFGLELREELEQPEEGQDGRICALADDMIKRCEFHTASNWSSLTIPAQQELLSTSLSLIIRLRFPEKTIWTLPQAAYLFGHVVLDQKKLNGLKWIEELSVNEKLVRQLKDLTAVGLATCIMGPAYACAAIMFGFDPKNAYIDNDQHMADAKRAYTVFAILDYMDKNAYSTIVEKMGEYWKTALKSHDQQVELKRGDKTQMDNWIKPMWQNLEDILGRPRAIYPAVEEEGWSVAQAWQKTYEDKGTWKSIEPSGTEQLRDVFNASWLCRIDHPDDVEKITREAVDFSNRILEERKGSPSVFEIYKPTKTRSRRKTSKG